MIAFRPVLAVVLLAGTPAFAATADRWVGAYGAPPIGYEPAIRDALPAPLHQQSVRQVVRASAVGRSFRLRLTNELGDKPLRIGAGSVVALDAAGRPEPGTLRPLRFAGQAGTTIPAGAPLLSDPIALPLTSDRDIVVTLYLPETSMPAAHAQMVEVASGDQTGRDTLTGATRARTAGLVSEIDVAAAAPARGLVTFGDSITEGAASTPGAHMSWPDQLGRRLAADPGGRCWSVVNAGISGNRLLHDGRGPNALARFDRDVLSVPGARTLVLLEGINDIGASAMPERAGDAVTAGQIIAALQELVDRAHAHGLRVIGGTLLPFGGAGYYTAAGETKRQAVNRWIRTPGTFDAVIDFDAAMRDPAAPGRMLEAAQSGDHLHPNDAGYTRMAAAALPTLLGEGCR